MKSTTDKHIVIGMIGTGFISQVHMRAYRKRNDVTVKALADTNQGLLASRGKEFGIRALYPDYRYMLEDPDINTIDIMTPHFLHATCVSDALKAKKNIICEKPVATNLKDLDMMIKTAATARKYIYIKQYLRFSSVNQKMQELLKQHAIGKPYLAQCTFTSYSPQDYQNPRSWRGNTKEAGGGVFMDIGVHMLDQLQLAFGSPISTFAQYKKVTTTLPQKGEDFACAMIEFPNDVMATINCTENDTAYGFRWEIRIYGTDGAIIIVDKGNQEKTLQVIKDNRIVTSLTETNWWEQANILALHDIIDNIQAHRSPTVSLDHARSVLNTIIQTYTSAATNKKISIRAR